MAIINDAIPVANIRSYIVDQETGLPNFVMIQSAPHLPLAAGIEQTKKAKKKKTSTHLERKSFIINAPQMLLQLCTQTSNSLRAGIMLPTHASNAEVNDTVNTIKKIITAPAR